MPYNLKQYDAAIDFITTGDANVANDFDKRRIGAYDLYENLYINSTQTLKLVLRGDDSYPILMPAGKKIVDATNRFLGVDFDYLVENEGDAGTKEMLEAWWADFFKRESIRAKFASSKKWGLVRGDAAFYIYANSEKGPGTRISIAELDPRQLFEIEDAGGNLIGVHVVDTVQDFRSPDKPDKKIARRRTFRKEEGLITTELKFFEIGKWDDRSAALIAKLTPVAYPEFDQEPLPLPPTITQLPIYKWRNNAPQNSTWGNSQLSGMETLLYAINQSLTDEDATIVFQGLGMYVTSAAPPQDTEGNTTDWSIGPMQIIEVGQDQRFDRVTGVSDVSPYQNHMNFIDEKGLSEASGTPQIAVGRVDVAVAESGISLQLQMMPLIAQNAEKELEMITVLDQMFFDITSMWIPAYEPELFPDPVVMSQMSVVTVFGDPMPKNRDAQVTETLTLQQANLILTSMAVQKLRSLGWNYPSVDPLTGAPLTDDMIAQMLTQQTALSAAALDPFSAQGGFGDPAQNAQEEVPQDQTIPLE